MTARRQAVYLLLALAICLLAPRIRLYPTDDLRIAKAFLVMSDGAFHLARPHLERAYAAYRAGALPDEQVTDTLLLNGVMLEQEGKPASAATLYQRAAQHDPRAAARLAAFRRLLLPGK